MGRPINASFVECQERPGEPIHAKELAAKLGIHISGIYNKIRKAGGYWFDIKGVAYRQVPKPPVAAPASAPTADPSSELRLKIIAALERGQDGVYSADDVKAAMGWANTIQRRWEELCRVLAGEADVIVDMGTVHAMWTNIKISEKSRAMGGGDGEDEVAA